MEAGVEEKPKNSATRKKQKPDDQVATSSTPATPVIAYVIKNLEEKLRAKYECDLATYLQERSKREAEFALANSQLEAKLALANSEHEAKLALAEKRTHDAQAETRDTLRLNAVLNRENRSLVEENTSVLKENTSVLEEVVLEKQRIRKDLLV
jgi:hypothetical protein